MELAQAVLTDEWWEDVTVPMLVWKAPTVAEYGHADLYVKRKSIYCDLAEAMGSESMLELPDLARGRAS